MSATVSVKRGSVPAGSGPAPGGGTLVPAAGRLAASPPMDCAAVSFAPDGLAGIRRRTTIIPDLDPRRPIHRRIYTDGRDWPKEIEPTFKGYSIGKWLDTDGDGRFDTLEVETRAIKGPRAYDTSGLPLHRDNETIVKEKLYPDKNDRVTLYDEITTIDHALTGPWTVTKKYTRDPDPKTDWIEEVCPENNPHVEIQGDNYFIGADGFLMPARKDQAPPDLRYFKQTQK
jgi:hypothetical protein